MGDGKNGGDFHATMSTEIKNKDDMLVKKHLSDYAYTKFWLPMELSNSYQSRSCNNSTHHIIWNCGESRSSGNQRWSRRGSHGNIWRGGSVGSCWFENIFVVSGPTQTFELVIFKELWIVCRKWYIYFQISSWMCIFSTSGYYIEDKDQLCLCLDHCASALDRVNIHSSTNNEWDLKHRHGNLW